MTVPTPTSEYLDLTTATFTENGSPTATLGQHSASNTTYTFDGVDDYLSSSEQPISGSSGTDHTISGWFKIPVGAEYQHLAQGNGDGGFDLRSDTAGRFGAYFYTGAANRIRSTLSNDMEDDTWHHVAVTVSSTEVLIYVDAVEGSYDTESEITGSWTGIPTTPGNLSVGAWTNGSNAGAGAKDRLKFWEGTILTAAQVLEEYNAERLAARSFLGDLTSKYLFNQTSGNILDSIASRDSATISGAPTYNGSSVTYDGIDDAHTWGSTVNPMDHSGDLTTYTKWRYIPDPDGSSEVPIDGNLAADYQQYLNWDDFNRTDEFRISWGSETKNITAGRLLTNTEIITTMVSYNRTTNVLSYVIQSDHPTTPYDLSGSFVMAADPSVQSLHLGKNRLGTVFANVEVYEMGSLNGTAKSVAEMTSTINAILNPVASEVDIFRNFTRSSRRSGDRIYIR